MRQVNKNPPNICAQLTTTGSLLVVFCLFSIVKIAAINAEKRPMIIPFLYPMGDAFEINQIPGMTKIPKKRSIVLSLLFVSNGSINAVKNAVMPTHATPILAFEYLIEP